MIDWINVNDKMPEAELEMCSEYRHYLILISHDNEPSIMSIARFYAPSKDKVAKWHPINYDNMSIYGYKNGGIEDANGICPHDYNYYETCDVGNCKPVSVTHWSPIEWSE